MFSLSLKNHQFFLITALCLLLLGCKTTDHTVQKNEEDIHKAVGTMAEVVGGQSLTEEQVKRLEYEISKDPEAQKAASMVTESLTGHGRIIKYCPVDGTRFAPHFEVCPVHHVSLKILED